MKYKAIAAFMGAALVMTAVTGCSTQQTEEPETLVISDMELIEETDSETLQDETQELAIDLSDELETQEPQSMLASDEVQTETETETESETELQTETSAAVTAQKQGEEETQEESEQQSESEASEEDTEQETEEETKKGKDKKPNPSKNKGKKPSAPVKPETDDTQKSSEAQGVSDMQDVSEAQGISGNTEAAETEESERNDSSKDEQSEAGKSESETESETQTTESESEIETESETSESESETEAESETSESETETGAGTAESESDMETESENAVFEQGLCFVNDRVNVRKGASEDAEILALLTPGMSVLALAEEGDWTQIRYEEADGFAEGYVKSEFLSGAEDVCVVKETINVRAEASTDSEKLGKFVGGETVLVVAEEGEWSQIRFTAAEGTVDAYVKTEFLETAETTDEGKLERLMNAEVEAESEVETEAESELESEVETEAESETATETETESESESETKAVTESESETKAESERESENATEAEIETEAKAESETEIKTETESESESETEIETETETESEPESETETESETEAVTETETETESEMMTGAETAASAVELSDGVEAQFELAKTLFPQMQTAGIIYSEGNAEAEVLIEEYTKLAEEYELELVTDTIEEEIDIDFAASEMVGNVDGIFCISDEMVDGLVQTIRAYADEVGIPVIGVDETHVEQGCVAAYEADTLYWNTEEAGKLGIDHAAISADEVKEM